MNLITEDLARARSREMLQGAQEERLAGRARRLRRAERLASRAETLARRDGAWGEAPIRQPRWRLGVRRWA